MHTPTQHSPHTNSDRFSATRRNPYTYIQTINIIVIIIIIIIII